MARKNFRSEDNPALQFISQETRDKKDREDRQAGNLPADPIGNETAGTAVPEGYKIVEESKTKRLQSLITPTTHTKLKRIAQRRGISVNEVVNMALKQFIESEGE